jgi:hypothetical protein
VAEAAGMVPAADLFAPHPLPRFDNSAMDGYALRQADVVEVPATLRVIGEVRAGEPGEIEVAAGTAARIMTGASVPPGADAIVPIEEAHAGDGTVTVMVAPRERAHIRPAGDDVKEGDLLVAAGIELGAGELALLASVGLSPVTVHRRPVVAVLATGDELVAPETEPGPGQIRDSNSVALRALIEEAGGEVRLVASVPDELAAVRAAVADAADGADLVGYRLAAMTSSSRSSRIPARSTSGASRCSPASPWCRVESERPHSWVCRATPCRSTSASSSSFAPRSARCAVVPTSCGPRSPHVSLRASRRGPDGCTSCACGSRSRGAT